MLKEKLMSKLEKKGKKLDPLEKEAKMGIAKEMSRQAGALLGGKIPAKKVTVAADSKEGLKEGLSKAEQIVEGAEEEMGADLDKDNEEMESDLHKMKVLGEKPPMHDLVKAMEDCSPEEIDEKIAELEALKMKMKSGQ